MNYLNLYDELLKESESFLSVTAIVNKAQFTRYKVYKTLEVLEENKLIMSTGKTKSKLYHTSLNTVDQIKMMDNLKKILLSHINNIGFNIFNIKEFSLLYF